MRSISEHERVVLWKAYACLSFLADIYRDKQWPEDERFVRETIAEFNKLRPDFPLLLKQRLKEPVL